MRAVMYEVPKALVEQRRQLGLDKLDELWNGVLHMVPPPTFVHQRVASRLVAFLSPRLQRRGLDVVMEAGLFRPGANQNDYRVPDLSFFRIDRPDLQAEHGLEGAVCVAEVRSPHDESYEKLPFYAALGVEEVIVIVPGTRSVEVFRLAGETYVATSADDAGRYHARSIDVRFATEAGAEPRLRVECDGEVERV